MIILSKKKMISFTNFDKGMNTTSFFDELSPEELVLGVNIDIKARGGYSQRGGCSVYKEFTEVGPITAMIDYPDNPLVVINSKLIKWDNTVLATLNSGTISWEFFTNSKLYILDGTQFWVYDGTTCIAVPPGSGSDLTPIKRCTKMIQRGQRLFTLGDPQNPNYMYFSEIGDPSIFLPSSSVKAVTDDKDVLKGLGLFSDALLAFKGDEIFKWTGWDPETDVFFTPLDTGHGCVSSDSIRVSGNYLIFADDDGVFCLNTVEKNLIKSYFVSKNISSDVFDALTDKNKMKAIVYKGNYYLACCNDSSGENNAVLKAHLGLAYNDASDQGVENLLFPWTVYSGWNVSDWLIIGDNLYFSSSKGPVIYQAFDGLDDVDTPVSSSVVHYFKLEDAVTRKKLKKLFLIAMQSEDYQTNLTLTIEAGYTTITKTANLISLSESGAWDVSDWDEVMWDWVDTVVKEIRIGENITRLKVTVTHSALGEGMTIYGFAAYYKIKKPRGSRDGITDIPTV